MRRIIALAVFMGLSLPLLSGCLSFSGGNTETTDKPGSTRVEKKTTTDTRTRTETEVNRP